MGKALYENLRHRSTCIRSAPLFNLDYPSTERLKLQRKMYAHDETEEFTMEKEYARSSVNQAFNAIRFLYVELYKQDIKIEDIPRPKRGRPLPKVLSEEEVGRLFDALPNLKHKAILMLIYSSGLRVGETVKLQITDIDSDRMLLHVRNGKGIKDRYTILAPSMLEVLRKYYKKYRPELWLFEGQRKGKPYTVRSVEKVFEKAKKKPE